MSEWTKDNPMAPITVAEFVRWLEGHCLSDDSGIYVRLANGTRAPLLGVSCIQTKHSNGQEVELVELLHSPGI